MSCPFLWVKEMQEKTYLEFKHTLLQPVGELIEVIVRPLSRENSREIEPKGATFTTAEKDALVMLSTGLTKDQLEQLTTMDSITLWEEAYKFYSKTSYELADEERDDTSREVTLHFSNDLVLTISYPTVRVSRLASKIENDIDRAAFIASQLTDLDNDAVLALPLPDYRTLVNAVSTFLTKPAAYFQKKASRP
ncbi:hypothetical protein BOO25_18475 [Vibrio navarrensis]|nr:hypothetical protein [Vibrio navarrensis]